MVNDDKEGLTLRVRRKYDGFGSNKGLVKRWWLDYITTKGCQRSHKRMMSYMNRPYAICGLSWPWHRPDTWFSSPQAPERLVNEWRFAKNFSTLPFIKPNDERKWNFQSVYSSLCFRTSYILYKLQCNISCGGHAVFSIGHISLFTEVKCWLCTFSTSYSPEAALEAQFFITKCTSL